MKLEKYLGFATILLIVVVSIFGQFVVFNDVNYTLIDVLSVPFDWPILLIILPYVLLLGSLILLFFVNKYKWISSLCLLLFALGGILFCFANGFYCYCLGVDESEVSLGAMPIILAIISFALCLYSNSLVFKENAFSVSDLVEIAIFIALAIVIDRLEFLKIRVVATGGSINFAMFPLMIIAIRHGFIKSFIACGIVYGFTTCLLDGYGFIYFPFDYLLGFGSVAFLGLFRKWILPSNNKKLRFKGILFLIIGTIIIIAGRTIASSISSMVYYQYSLSAALIYNLSYIPASCGLSLVIVILLYKPLLIMNYKISRKHLDLIEAK